MIYEMSLTGTDANIVESVVNQGIDSHLEALTKSNFTYEIANGVRRLKCEVDYTELPTLIRRLKDFGEDGTILAQSILSAMDIEDVVNLFYVLVGKEL